MPSLICFFRLGLWLGGCALGGALLAAPVISTQPQRLVVLAGQPAVFSVVATDSAALSYQWWRNAEPIVGATGAGFTVPAPTLADSGAVFRVTVFSVNGRIDSATAVLTVRPVAPFAYANWALGVPDAAQRGPLDDPAGDGVFDLLKYAFDVSPTWLAGPTRWPTLGCNGDSMAYCFERDRRAAGIVATIVGSSPLAGETWTVAAAAEIGDDGRNERWESSFDTSGGRLFRRVRVAAQAPAASVPTIGKQP